MRVPRGPDDADVIRARLRSLLAEGAGGWTPEEVRAVDREPAPATVLDPPELGDGDADVDEDEASGPAPADASPSVGRHRAPVPAARIDPGRPGARALWAAAVVAVLALLALTWWDRPVSAPVPATPSPSAPAAERAAATPPAATGEATPSPSTVVVSVVGRVVRPGLVTLPVGARVADALEAAGGPLPGTDSTTVNLAAPLADGQQVAVGVPAATSPPDPSAGPSGAGSSPVDLNSAGVAELEVLPGIGPVLAQRIVDHREQHGAFAAVDDLQDVPGIGPAVFDGLADAVTV